MIDYFLEVILTITQDIRFPVIAIDGPAASGKGTYRQKLARHFNFHELDSGVLYRAVALLQLGRNFSIETLVEIARNLDIQMCNEKIFLHSQDVTKRLRSAEISSIVPEIAKIPKVREAVRTFQLGMRKSPGLVADGRDMGQIFQEGQVIRFFISASAQERARRRQIQYERQLNFQTYGEILRDIESRDRADMNRDISPLKVHENAFVVDTTDMTIEQTFDYIVLICKEFGLRQL